MAEREFNSPPDHSGEVVSGIVNLPTPEQVTNRVDGMIESAVQEHLPAKVEKLVSGMMPGIRELLDAGWTKEQVKDKATPYVENYVDLFDSSATQRALDDLYSRIDNA